MANLAERARRLNRRRQGGFALLTDAARLPDPLPLLALLPRGAFVVLRHYGAPDRTELARALAKECRARGLVLLIADDLDLAVTLGAGLHLPEWRARNAGARVRLWHRGSRRLLTAAAHGRAALARVAELGADAALLGPVFAPASHPGARPLGALRFRLLVRDARVKVWALGGVTAASLPMLAGGGVAGIATVGGLPHPL